MLHPCNRRESFIRAHTKPPQSCEERKSAPPNEVQFNAPTTGGGARHNASLLAVSNMSCFMVLGDLWVVCDYCGVWSIGFNLLQTTRCPVRLSLLNSFYPFFS